MFSKCLDYATPSQVQMVRWQVYQMAGKVVHHSGAVLLKVAEDVLVPSGPFGSGAGGFGARKGVCTPSFSGIDLERIGKGRCVQNRVKNREKT